VYARHNAVDTPALLPDGSIAESSLSRVLTARGERLDPRPMAGTATAVETLAADGKAAIVPATTGSSTGDDSGPVSPDGGRRA
jgi:NADH-quinone oxidoreductase subunit J